MKYLHFRGCSLNGTGVIYRDSIEGVCGVLDLELTELEDWNCCGAAPYFSTPENISRVLCGRNLALAERAGYELVTSCNTCYGVLQRTHAAMAASMQVRDDINGHLESIGMSYKGTVVIRHLLELIINEAGIDRIRELITNPLEGFRVACFYGCQGLRPSEISFDLPGSPVMLDNLMAAAGGVPVRFGFGTKCCGGSLVGTGERLAYPLLDAIFLSAYESGAQCIVTSCPMCQVVLETYQEAVNREFNRDYRLSVLYFTQLLGLAMGVPQSVLGIDRMIGSVHPVLEVLCKKAV